MIKLKLQIISESKVSVRSFDTSSSLMTVSYKHQCKTIRK